MVRLRIRGGATGIDHMNIKLKTIKTKRTDVLCVACGGFQAFEVFVLDTGVETDFGVHSRCVELLHVKRGRTVASNDECPSE